MHESASARQENGALEPVDPFSMEELSKALTTMKNGKAKDDAGIIAEMLKQGSVTLLTIVLSVFNDILCFRCLPPAAWKRSRLTAIYKKDDAALPGNYRTIAILPMLYKVFSRMLCQMLTTTIMAERFQYGGPPLNNCSID